MPKMEAAMTDKTVERLRTIAERAARAGTSVHPRYILAVIDGRKA